MHVMDIFMWSHYLFEKEIMMVHNKCNAEDYHSVNVLNYDYEGSPMETPMKVILLPFNIAVLNSLTLCIMYLLLAILHDIIGFNKLSIILIVSCA
jgi:hypothetical protein